MKPAIFYLAVLIFFSCILKSCSKINLDPRNRAYGGYRLKGSAHFVFRILHDGVPPKEYDLPDSGAVFIDKIADPDSSSWIRLTGVLADYETDVFNFNRTGTPIVALYTDTLITIPLQEPLTGFGSSVQGTATLKNGILTINYVARYRELAKTAVISSY